MSSNPDQRPLSPFMIGPYYKPQITSMLSITSRATGVWLTFVAAPLAIVWLYCLAAGPETYSAFMECLGGLLGQLALLGSLFCLSYHFMNGLRHLAWDMGYGFEMNQVRASGWLMLIASIVMTALVWMVAS